jgi:hypothetical protein
MRIRQHVAAGAVLAAVLALTPAPARAVVDPGLASSPGETARYDIRRAAAAVRPADAQLARVRELVQAPHGPSERTAAGSPARAPGIR